MELRDNSKEIGINFEMFSENSKKTEGIFGKSFRNIFLKIWKQFPQIFKISQYLSVL